MKAICLSWKLTSLCISRNCCLIFHFLLFDLVPFSVWSETFHWQNIDTLWMSQTHTLLLPNMQTIKAACIKFTLHFLTLSCEFLFLAISLFSSSAHPSTSRANKVYLTERQKFFIFSKLSCSSKGCFLRPTENFVFNLERWCDLVSLMIEKRRWACVRVLYCTRMSQTLVKTAFNCFRRVESKCDFPVVIVHKQN